MRIIISKCAYRKNISTFNKSVLYLYIQTLIIHKVHDTITTKMLSLFFHPYIRLLSIHLIAKQCINGRLKHRKHFQHSDSLLRERERKRWKSHFAYISCYHRSTCSFPPHTTFEHSPFLSAFFFSWLVISLNYVQRKIKRTSILEAIECKGRGNRYNIEEQRCRSLGVVCIYITLSPKHTYN